MRSDSIARCLGGSFAAVLVSLCTLPSARANIHLAVGSRLEPVRYTSPYFPNPGAATLSEPSLSGGLSNSFQSTSLSPYLTVFFAQRYGVMASLDMAYAKVGAESQLANMMPPSSDNNSYFQFGFSLGMKTYITEPRANKVAPYVYADFFKYFASISTDNMNVTGEKATAQAQMRSPVGITLAAGVEYFFTPSFSVGSEILGFRYAHVSGEYRDDASMTSTRHSLSYDQVAFYTGLTLNFRFQVSGAGKTSEEERESNGKRSARDYPPPPAPPPPTPEAVD